MRKLAPGLLAGAVAAVGCLYGTTATASAAPTATPSVATAAALAVTTAARAAAVADVHPVTIVITTDPDPGNDGTSDEQTARTGVKEQFDGAAQYWRTTSEGKVDFRLDGFDDAATWFPGHGTCGATGAERDADYATAKARAGFQAGPSKHFILVVANCNANGGVGTQPSSLASGGNVYLEGYRSKGVWAHEIGHNLSFGHGDRLSCASGAVDGPVYDEPGATTSGCSTYDYGDEVDVMGFSRAGAYKSFAAPHRVREGFYGPESYFTVDSDQPTDQRLDVVPRALASGKRAVAATDPRTGTTYYFEYATPVGEDAGVVNNLNPDDFAGQTWVQRPGVRVLRLAGPHGLLLTPPANAQNHRTMFWPVGSTFTSPGGGLTMDVITQDDGSATLRVRSTPTALPTPTTDDDTATRRAGDATPIDVLSNDQAPAGQTLDRTSVVFPDAGQPTGASVSTDRRTLSVPNQGVYTAGAMTGTIVFTAADGYTGTADAITYQVAASGGGTATGTLVVTAQPSVGLPSAPTAVDDTVTRKADDTGTIDVLANDVADATRTLEPTSLVFTEADQPTGARISDSGRSLTIDGGATYTIDPTTGRITLDPEDGYTGTLDPVTYRVADDADATDTATLTVTVTLPSGRTAQATPDYATTTVSDAVTTDVLANDNATGGRTVDPATVVLISASRQTTSPSATRAKAVRRAAAAVDGRRELTVASIGTWTVTASGSIRFSPADGFVGTTVLRYGFTDVYGQDARSTLTIDVVADDTGDGNGTGGDDAEDDGAQAVSEDATNPSGTSGALPGTGGPALALLTSGLLALGTGAVLVARGRRPRGAASRG